MFTSAIVRPPTANFFEGLTTAGLGAPDYERALSQHEAYCVALRHCGLDVISLEAEPDYPDSTFVEDTAILSRHRAILTRPGAPARSGEIASMRSVLAKLFPSVLTIESPGTLDGGDVCEAGDHFFIGISERTNQAGAEQLAGLVDAFGCTSSFVDIRGTGVPPVAHAPDARPTPELLHLKSGLAFLGDNRLVVTEAIAARPEFHGYELVRVNSGEEYAANCVRVNDYVLLAAGYQAFESELRALGYQTIALEMSEFQKMDGGLSCLSLRF